MSLLSEIKETLNNIASSKGLSGVSVDLAKDLLAQAIFYDKINSLSIVNKNSIDTTTNMNAIISYALTNLYPVFRGRNSIIRVRGYFKSGSVNLKRGTKVFSSKLFNLYLAQDLAPGLNDDASVALGKFEYYSTENEDKLVPVDVDLIVAKNYISDVLFNKVYPFYLECSNIKDVSENCRVTKKTKGVGTATEIKVTKYLGEHTDQLQLIKEQYAETGSSVLDPLPLLLTSYDFGVRLYPCETSPKTVDGKTITKLVPNQDIDKYYLDYFPYYDYVPSYDDVKNVSIEGFQIINKLKDESGEWHDQTNFDPEGIDLIEYAARETPNDGTVYKIKINLVEMQKIRSNYDICDTFNKVFEDVVYNSSYKYSGKTVGGSIVNSLTIYYIPKTEGYQIDQDRLNDYRDRFLYPILDVTSNTEEPKFEVCDAIKVNLIIRIQSAVPVSTDEINASLETYNYRPNLQLTLNEVYGKVNKVNNVMYANISAYSTRTKDGHEETYKATEGENGVINIINPDWISPTSYILLSLSVSNELIDETSDSR